MDALFSWLSNAGVALTSQSLFKMASRSNNTIDQVITNVGSCLGYEQVKEEQRQGVKAIIDGRDVFVAQPTGYGKSAIYQMAPFVKSTMDLLRDSHSDSVSSLLPEINKTQNSCFALVICPLISLMRDQMQKMTEKGIKALSLSDPDTTSKVIRDGDYSFLFTSPESILKTYRSEVMMPSFQKRLVCVVIDESHCIVKWYVCLYGFLDFIHFLLQTRMENFHLAIVFKTKTLLCSFVYLKLRVENLECFCGASKWCNLVTLQPG